MHILPFFFFFFFNDTATTEIYTLSLHDALPISHRPGDAFSPWGRADGWRANLDGGHLLVFDGNGHRYTVLARRLSEGFEFEFAGRRRQVKTYPREGYRLPLRLADATLAGAAVPLG